MTKTKSYTRYTLSLVILASIALCSWQAFAKSPVAGKMALVTGKATVFSIGGDSRKLMFGEMVYEGETIETEEASFVKLKYTDGGVMLLRPATKIIIEEYKFTKKGDGESITNLVKGGLRAVTGGIVKRNRDNYKIKTPVATVSVRGTDMTVRLCRDDCKNLQGFSAPAPDNGLYTGVNKGGIILSNAAGSQLYRVGQFGYVAGTQFKPGLLPSAPAIFVTDNLPDPSANNNFIKDSSCK